MKVLAVAVLGRGLVPPDEPLLPVDDEGFLRGRAVFDRLRVYDGRPFRLREHVARLAASALRVGLAPLDEDAFVSLGEEAAAAATQEPDLDLRLFWTPGRESGGEPLGFAFVATLSQSLDAERERGLRLITLRVGRRLLAGAKSTSYAENLAARDEAARNDADDALLVDEQGRVLEGTTANVWWREGDRILTPSLELPVLEGVTRGALVELAPASGFEVEEGVFPLGRLLDADEAFVSSSIREVMPVVAIDGAPIGDGRPGRAVAALQQALRDLARAG